MTDSSGNSLGTVNYYPFGSVRSGTVPTDVLFKGQRLDDTGLYYSAAGYYDSNIGSFISPHTHAKNPNNPQSLNAYVSSSPNFAVRSGNVRRPPAQARALAVSAQSPPAVESPSNPPAIEDAGQVNNPEPPPATEQPPDDNYYQSAFAAGISLAQASQQKQQKLSDRTKSGLWQDLYYINKDMWQHMLNSKIYFEMVYVNTLLSYVVTKVYENGGLNFVTPIIIQFVNEYSPMWVNMEIMKAGAFSVYPSVFIRTDIPISDEYFDWQFAHESFHLREQSIEGISWYITYLKEIMHAPNDHNSWPSEQRANAWAWKYYPY